MDQYKLARLAYEAYRKASDGKSLISGAPIPPFDELSDPIREAWRHAADAVMIECTA